MATNIRRTLGHVLRLFFPKLYDKLLAHKWRKAYKQRGRHTVYFNKMPDEVDVEYIGDYSYCVNPIIIDSATKNSKIYVGRFSSLGKNLSLICSGEHRLDGIALYQFIIGKPIEYGRIKIGNDVWIGEDVTIMGGVTIPDGVVLGAKSLVTKSSAKGMRPFSIYAGIPARLVRTRFPEKIVEKLIKLDWYDMDPDVLFANKEKFYDKDIESAIAEMQKLKNKSSK